MSSIQDRMDLILEALSDEAQRKASNRERLQLNHARLVRASALKAARGLSGPVRGVYVGKARKAHKNVKELTRDLNKKYGNGSNP